jgi:hypothetical protein
MIAAALAAAQADPDIDRLRGECIDCYLRVAYGLRDRSFGADRFRNRVHSNCRDAENLLRQAIIGHRAPSIGEAAAAAEAQQEIDHLIAEAYASYTDNAG